MFMDLILKEIRVSKLQNQIFLMIWDLIIVKIFWLKVIHHNDLKRNSIGQQFLNLNKKDVIQL